MEGRKEEMKETKKESRKEEVDEKENSKQKTKEKVTRKEIDGGGRKGELEERKRQATNQGRTKKIW